MPIKVTVPTRKHNQKARATMMRLILSMVCVLVVGSALCSLRRGNNAHVCYRMTSITEAPSFQNSIHFICIIIAIVEISQQLQGPTSWNLPGDCNLVFCTVSFLSLGRNKLSQQTAALLKKYLFIFGTQNYC